MANYVFPTSTALNLEGAATDAQVQSLRQTLSDISATAYVLDPLTASSSAYADVAAGTVKFMWGHIFDSPLAGDGMLFGHAFGMEAPEFMGWWLQGGGSAAVAAELATAAQDVVLFPMPRFGESTGWYREAMTLKKFREGLYSNGDSIKFRIFGDGQTIHNNTFPQITTPAATPGQSFLNDVFAGVFNGGEFGDATMDASAVGGLFPNWPSKTGSIVEALGGNPHYYIGSWHTPARMQALWVNKTFYDGLAAQDKAWVKAAAEAASMDQMAQAQKGQDALIKTMQSLGVIVHERLPYDVLVALRDAAAEYYASVAAASPGGPFDVIYQSQVAWIQSSQVRNRASMDRYFRYGDSRYQDETTTLIPNAR